VLYQLFGSPDYPILPVMTCGATIGLSSRLVGAMTIKPTSVMIEEAHTLVLEGM
jgi:hypothetical protein